MAHSGIYFTSTTWKLSEEKGNCRPFNENMLRVVVCKFHKSCVAAPEAHLWRDTRGRRASLRLKEQEKWSHHSSNGAAQTAQLFSTQRHKKQHKKAKNTHSSTFK
jgi:hypothetical protein